MTKSAVQRIKKYLSDIVKCKNGISLGPYFTSTRRDSS